MNTDLTPTPPVDPSAVRAWQVVKFEDRASLLEIAEEARRSLPIANYEHDLEWMIAAGDKAPSDIVVLVDRDGDRLVGIAPFASTQSRLDYSLANVRLPSPRVRRLLLEDGPVIGGSNPHGSVLGFLNGLSSALSRGTIAFLQAVPVGSPLYAALSQGDMNIRSKFFVLPWNPENLHCRVRWTGNVDAYLASISKGMRYEFRRSSQKLHANKSLNQELKRFTTPQEVDDFFRDAVAISEKTYQTKHFGLGLTYGGPTEALARFAAARRTFLGYVLYINGAPAAFRYALTYGSTCFMILTGYDPTRADLQVGNVLFLDVLKDLEATKAPFEVLDCLTFPTEFKRRTTNEHQAVQDFYLFGRTTGGAFQYVTMMALHRLSRFLIDISDRLHVKQKIKRWLRRRASA